MKQFSCFLLLSIFLASCANPVTPVTSVIVTSQATATLTPSPTATKEATATPVDPNAPKDGYDTKENKNGEWVYHKEINGVKATWTKVETAQGKDAFYEWTYSAIKDPGGKIPIIDARAYAPDWSSKTFMTVNLLPQADGQSDTNLFIQHPDPTSSHQDENSRLLSLPSRIFNDLAQKLGMGRGQNFVHFLDQYYERNGAKALDITLMTPDGKTYHWNPARDYIVTQVPFDEATGPEFKQVPYDDGSDVIYRLALTSDEHNNLHAFMAVSKDISMLTDKQQSLFVLAGFLEAVSHADGSPMVNVKNSRHWNLDIENRTNSAVSESGYSYLDFTEE